MAQYMAGRMIDAESAIATLGLRYSIGQDAPSRVRRVLLRAYAEYYTPICSCAVRRRVRDDVREFNETGRLPFYALRMCTL